MDGGTILNELHKKGISIRFRVARNFKNQYYGKADELLLAHTDLFLQKPEIKDFLQYGKIYPFDEDHIRAEYFFSPTESLGFPDIFFSKEIFDYQKFYGYLTACPTNSGRGNKISLKIPLDLYPEERCKEMFGVFSNNIIFYKYDPFYIIYLKNFNMSRIYNFLDAMYFYLG